MATFQVDYVLMREVRDGTLTIEADNRQAALAVAYALIQGLLPEPKSEFEIKLGVAKKQDV